MARVLYYPDSSSNSRSSNEEHHDHNSNDVPTYQEDEYYEVPWYSEENDDDSDSHDTFASITQILDETPPANMQHRIESESEIWRCYMINGNTTTSSSNYINIQNSSDESQDIQNSQESNWTVHYDSPAEGYVYPRIHQYRNPQDNAMSITEHNLESSEDEVTDDESIVSSISSQVHEDDIPHFQDMNLNPPSSSQGYYRHQTMLPPGYFQVQHSSNMHQAKPVTLLTANAATARHRKKRHADPDESILGSASSILNWLCDTGATAHMTPRLDDLQDV